MDHTDFMKIVRQYNANKDNEDSNAAKLRKRIMHENHSNAEWLELQEELRCFIAANPSQEELNQLQGCGESLAMICSAIKVGALDEN